MLLFSFRKKMNHNSIKSKLICSIKKEEINLVYFEKRLRRFLKCIQKCLNQLFFLLFVKYVFFCPM